MERKPSILQPWTKYYRKEPLREFDVNQTFDELLYNANCNNLEYNAVNFMGIPGNSWTYGELFALRDKLAHAFVKAGVKKDDTVLIATISGLDEPLCMMALNKIGAVSKWVDVTYTADEFEEAINAHGSKHIVVFSLVLPQIEKILHNTDVQKVLVVEPTQYVRPFRVMRESLSGIKELAKLKEEGKNNPLPAMPHDDKYMKFMDFVKSGSNKKFEGIKYDKDRPVLMIQSSGTTGKPKVITHTDFSINNSILKFSYLDLPLYERSVMLKVAPAWVGYGLINTMGLGLAYGMEVVTTPMLKDDMLITYNQKYDVVFGVPLLYRYLDSHLDEVDDMSRPDALISGGDKIEKVEINKFEADFASKDCEAPILNGAGNNEILGAGFVNPLVANKPGTVGIPMYRDIVSIFDPDTLEEKDFNEEGEVCVKSDSAFLYYDGNEEETKKVKRVHPDGSVWIHTNDLGKMDEDGYLYLIGRISRVITVRSFKISASQIEEVIQNYPAVKEAVAVSVPDEELEHVPMVYLTIEEKYKDQENTILEEIDKLCKEQLKELAVPRYYKVIDSIPYTSNNKQNFRQLEADGKAYVESLQSQKVIKK